MNRNDLFNSTFSTEELKDYKSFLFVFDGAYAYSPKRSNAYKFMHESKCGVPAKIRDEIDREKRRVSRTPILDLLYKSEFPNKSLIFYFAQTSTKEAKKIILEIQKTHKEFEINLLGYSWGADAAMRLSRFLEKKQVQINKVYTLDPVRRGLLWLGFTRSIQSNTNYFEKLSNMKSLYNIYQKSDRYALPLIHLRGNYVQGADLNLNLSDLYPAPNHINLIQYKEVQSFLSL